MPPRRRPLDNPGEIGYTNGRLLAQFYNRQFVTILS